MTRKQINVLLWVVLAVFVIYRIALFIFPQALPGAAFVLAGLPFVFALIHGVCNYRFRDVLVFLAITLVISNLLENCSILTGFPFGHYYYTDYLGPKLFLVPGSISLAYFGMGYLSWMLARVILGNIEQRMSGHFTYTVPLLAGFLMVSWDLTFDPIASTILHSWIWLQGGSYYGVPFSNFIGWFFTVYVFFQLFALYLKSRPNVYARVKPEISKGYWLQAATFYGITGFTAVMSALVLPADDTIADATGALWHIQDIIITCGLVALFTMIAFTFLSIVKIAGLREEGNTTGKNNSGLPVNR